MKALLILLIILPQIVFCQNENLQVFDNLVNRNWLAEGKWSDGSVFKQEVSYAYSLENNIITTNSKGFVDKENKIYGDRNHGLRKYDESLKEIQFWEFDVFGGVTKGTVIPIENNILYQYQYGDSYLSEMWQYVNDSTYNFKVGDYRNGDWNQIYLSTQFKAKQANYIGSVYSNLKNNLSGNWSCKAWGGVLNESWFIDEDGYLVQNAQYIENQLMQYEAMNKIELINNELILFTVIKNGNPKIFKASSYTNNEIVFSNTDYKNPSKVVYKLISNTEFNRTISGMEGKEPTSYSFEFKKEN